MNSEPVPAFAPELVPDFEPGVVLTLELPLPSRLLSPNWRGHWTAAAAAKRKARALAKVETFRVLGELGLDPPRWKKARYVARYLHTANRFPDRDDFIAMLKSYLDGIADGGLLAPDRDLWPDRPEFAWVKRLPRVEITIEREE